ncbi:sugar phosphate nucleotidyltransferase [Halobaculum rubrum]|uniref:sugar phosphate nucleotidyltransferase n=1 Tax=Halobaculum rubrum TaxID=2872158 RepID=UPI001CA41810|nr:sugar phosphate nucleotidyltransferase [Halobaculum rubrum]QZX99898.1 NTP transferase domain-containing protein [Halobaculum rubrum]
MRVLIPAAGQGTRLYPQTHTKPKAMVRLAGRPILGHILDSVAETDVDEVILVVGGPMQDQITEYAVEEYGGRFDFEFVEQEAAEGLGHSVYQARHVAADEPVFIALGDMLFENGYEQFLEAHRSLGDVDGSLGVKRVDDPQHYGVAELGSDDHIVDLVEKPDDPPSEYAISGVYIIEDSESLFQALEHLVEKDIRGAGDEYQLTDALSRMVDQGADLHTFEVEDWYDCGRPETLLEANRVLLADRTTSVPDDLKGSVVVPPVDIGSDVTLESSVVGPNVSVDDGASIENSILSDAILGEGAAVETVNLDESIIGDNATVTGDANQLNVGDNSSINL